MKVQLINFHCILRYGDTANSNNRYSFVTQVQANEEGFTDILDLAELRNTYNKNR